MDQPLITFTIPFYSRPEYLRAAIDSVCAQTRSEWKLVIVDDCSSISGVAELVVSYGDERISYIENERNLGLAGNWNRCLDHVETELFTILHADDQLLPNYMEIMLQAAGKWPEAAAYFCRSYIIDGQGRSAFSFRDFVKRFIVPTNKEPFLLKGENALEQLLKGNFIMCPTLCYRKEKLVGQRFSPEWKCLPDMDLTSRLILNGATLVGLPQVGYQYRRHEDSVTANTIKNLLMFKEDLKMFSELGTEAAKRNWKKAEKRASRATIIKLKILYFALLDFVSLRLALGVNKLVFLGKVMFFPRHGIDSVPI